MKFKKYKGVTIRTDAKYEGTDKKMVSECLENYDKFSLDNQSVVLDLGVNCGGFSHMCKEKNVAYYLGLEPLENNYNVALQNLPENGELYHAATTASNDDEISFYLRKSKQFSCSSTANPAKVTKALIEIKVKNLNIYQILNKKPWTHLKIDVEGAEKDFLNDSFKIPDSVKEMSLEIHSEKYSKEYAESAHLMFLKEGFKLIKAAPNYGFASKEPVYRELFGVKYTGSLFGFDLFYKRI